MRIERLPGVRSSSLAGTGFTSTTTGGTAIVGTNSTNGLSLGVPNFLTTAMASNRGSDFVQATAGFNGTNVSGTIASNSLSFSVAGQVTLSRTVVPTPHILSFISALGSSMVQGSLSLQYMPLACHVSASRAAAFLSVAVGTNAASTGQMGLSAWIGVYSLNGSTLSLASSQSTTYSQSWSSNTTGSVNGARRVSMAMNMNGTPGEWWCGIVVSTSSGNLANTVVMAGGPVIGSNNFADFSVLTTATMGQPAGLGIYSATTNGMPASIAFSEISQTGTNAQRANVVFEFANTGVW